jgi:hypothetical protein
MSDDMLRMLRENDARLAITEVKEAPTGHIRTRVYNTAAIVLTTGVAKVLTFDSERWDTALMHSTSVNTSRLTAPIFGLYAGTGYVRFGASAVGIRELSVAVNGATTIAIQDLTALAAGVTIMQINWEYELSAGDYVELVAFQNSGGNLNVDVAANYSPEFSAVRIA